jgi:NAD(P)-dependent dehydrogenase (short-subunit alcohol dehydrogenase family)
MREKMIRGRMLFVTSLHAESPRNLPHYSASKAGQTMLMKELARALGPSGIRVNAIAPGAVRAPASRAHRPGDKIPLKRLAIRRHRADGGGHTFGEVRRLHDRRIGGGGRRHRALQLAGGKPMTSRYTCGNPT